MTSFYLPFLMVSLPINGPRTGSNVSSKFSIKTASPAASAVSIASRYLLKKKIRILPQNFLTQEYGIIFFHSLLTLSVQRGWPLDHRHICSWSTWFLAAVGLPGVANAGRNWEWWHSRWTFGQQAALHFAMLQCPHHLSAWWEGPGQASLGWEP